jgi:DUF971 family protein
VESNSLTPQQKTPTNIDVDLKQKEVRIVWADGFQSTYALDYLRQICPCAGCDELRQNQDPLCLLPADQIVITAELQTHQPVTKVGSYALQFFWADGHNTGIYSFKFLRQKSPPMET